jgi:hypothetical protein
MIVDLEDREEAGTFDLKGGGKVTLRLRSAQDEKEIRAACVKQVVEYPLLDGKYQRFESEKTDMDLYIEMSWDKNIAGWEGVVDGNKEPVPVTKENKIRLMRLAPAFRNAVEAGLKALADASKAKAEQAEKN